MNITILTYGSRGDVQPFLALAVGLQRAGHQVKLAAPYRFETFINEYGVSCVPLPGDPEIISQRLNAAGANPIGMVRAISDYVFSIADKVAYHAFAACDDADLIIHSFLFTTGRHSLARKLDIHDVSIQTFPVFAPTRAFPPVSAPNLPSGPLSYFFHWLTTQIFWHGGNIGYRRLRKTDLETFDLDLRWPFSSDDSRLITPLVLACSPAVISRPDDWSASHIHIPGYLFLDKHTTYQPPVLLSEFLSAGESPACASFCSIIHCDAESIYRTMLDALTQTGNRAVILNGWSLFRTVGYSRIAKQLSIMVVLARLLLVSVPESKILWCRLTPTDLSGWARVHAIGAGPNPILVKKLTVGKLVAALAEVEEGGIRNGAQVVGRKIRAKNRVDAVVHLIEIY